LNLKIAPKTAIFHYTDANGLIGILSSSTLFATDYRYLNDPSEASEIKKLILPVFQSEIAEISPKLVEKNFLNKKFYEDFGTNVHSLEAEAMYRSMIRAIDNVSPFFLLSFCRHYPGSEEFNHGLLSQWRGYASGGGFAIEFDEEKLDALVKEEYEKFSYAGFRSDNVVYEDHQELLPTESFRGVAGELVRRLFEGAGKDISAITGHKNFDEAAILFAKTAPFLKHVGFSEEEEYRISMICLRLRRGFQKAKEEKRKLKPISFRSRGSLVVPYIKLFEGFDKPLPIKSIIVGPHPYQDAQKEAALMLLESYGLDVEVRLSSIPYRH
jgi:hypothetical protein